MLIDELLFSAVRISTFSGARLLTSASGFLYERSGRLFLVTSRHVLHDAPGGHHPDRIEFVIHTDAVDLTSWATLSILLYRDGVSQWRQGIDSGGEVDVAVIELQRAVLPPTAVLRPFSAESCAARDAVFAIGSPVLVVGYPLGFYDTVHQLPVVRSGAVASAYGVRFQGKGYFLNDARTHRGTSGAPVVVRSDGPFPWTLLGIHSASLDMNTREDDFDERLGLGCVWYADILETLTQPSGEAP
ncbi:S1 family peptidase [Ramlibacter rhizophilus]|uniref:Serine protease n=1 Tax=Ramlibacter rhizophilus TaxID=1781167 RepID=A0A4Z0C0F5_9BURK|nr:serine protease [Ramlibacter rhizophilus]TFZ05013.1 serine protease [Ramlibacter rhizophilus]